MPNYSRDYARGLADGRSDAELDLANSAVFVVALVRAMTEAAARLETALRQVAQEAVPSDEISDDLARRRQQWNACAFPSAERGIL